MTYPLPGIYPQSLTLRDAKGRTSSVRFFVNLNIGTPTLDDATTQIDLILNAIAVQGTAGTKLTNAASQAAHGIVGFVGSVQYGLGGAANEYGDIRQKAVMVFQDAAGKFHRYAIPAPRSAIFLADGVTVNPAQTQVAAFNAAVIGNTNGAAMSDIYGNVMKSFVGGYFQDRKARRASVLRLTPQLTAQIPGDE